MSFRNASTKNPEQLRQALYTIFTQHYGKCSAEGCSRIYNIAKAEDFESFCNHVKFAHMSLQNGHAHKVNFCGTCYTIIDAPSQNDAVVRRNFNAHQCMRSR